jgi:hypothetical protein
MSTSPSWLESADQSGSSMLHERHLHARPDTRAIARSCAAREGCDSAQNKCSGFVRGGGDGGGDGRTLRRARWHSQTPFEVSPGAWMRRFNLWKFAWAWACFQAPSDAHSQSGPQSRRMFQQALGADA